MPGTPRRWTIDDARADSWIRIGLVVAAFAPFVATLFYGFVYDDTEIILHNHVLQGWRSLIAVWTHPYWASGDRGASGLYRPMFMFLFAIIWNGAHKYAIAFHFFVIALHAAATLLVLNLLRRVMGRWPAAAGALWFALHPVHVESVANLSNSSEVLVSVWTLLLAIWLLRFVDATGTAHPPAWSGAIVAAVLYAAALMTKESGGVAPALALLVAFAWRKPESVSFRDSLRDSLREWRGWWRVIALLLLVIVGVVAARHAVMGGFTGTRSLAVPGLAELSRPGQVVAALSTGGTVLRLLVWPVAQTPDYGPDSLLAGSERVLAAAATVLTIVLLVSWSVRLALFSPRRDARPFIGIAWCLIAYFPASNLVAATGAIVAERTLYNPSIGIAILVACAVEWGIAKARAGSQVLEYAVAAVFALICFRGFTETRSYARVWRDHHALFTRMVQIDPLGYRGHQLLAAEAKDHKRFRESDSLFTLAYSLRPSDPILLTDYGEYEEDRGHHAHALALARRLFRRSDVQKDSRSITLLLNTTARVEGVDSVLAAATRLNASSPSPRAALFVGMAYDVKGDTTAAQAAYRAGLRATPGDSALTAHLSRPTRGLAPE
jgi:hypothetical protein